MREDDEQVPETEERPEAEPTSLDDPAEGEGTHRGW